METPSLKRQVAKTGLETLQSFSNFKSQSFPISFCEFLCSTDFRYIQSYVYVPYEDLLVDLQVQPSLWLTLLCYSIHSVCQPVPPSCQIVPWETVLLGSHQGQQAPTCPAPTGLYLLALLLWPLYFNWRFSHSGKSWKRKAILVFVPLLLFLGKKHTAWLTFMISSFVLNALPVFMSWSPRSRKPQNFLLYFILLRIACLAPMFRNQLINSTVFYIPHL